MTQAPIQPSLEPSLQEPVQAPVQAPVQTGVASALDAPESVTPELHAQELHAQELHAQELHAQELRVTGRVQGVGFRPTVYRLAKARGLRGEVFNDAAGVLIRVAGSAEALAQFRLELEHQAPPLARVDAIQVRSIAIATVTQTAFEITPSQLPAAEPGQSIQTQISPDAATCPQCLSDTLDPFSRFFRYPFTNCTHCGPRLSIVRRIPYDRQHTSMAAFEMCPDCRAAYEDPGDRRFHAQPVACHRCGPRAWLERADGRPVVSDMFSMLDDVDAVATLLQRGEIVAIKGVGGFHLACDATNDQAVAELRRRKQRDDKPFALMVRDLTVIEPHCVLSDGARTLLQSPAAPIVLLPRRAEAAVPLAEAIAPNSQELGVMLPYTPLHHLMLKRMNRPVVMTSGNRSDEPQCIDNAEAREKLGDIATYFLFHNRDIVNRVDDSVLRPSRESQAGAGLGLQTLRRARGYAPAPLMLPQGFETAPAILALGGELKSTFCLIQGQEAVLSQHLGDLEQAAALTAYRETLTLYQQLFEHQPVAIATDLHPDYLSTQLGQTLAEAADLPLMPIQHHHAHIAAVMAERGLPRQTEPVLGIALDGLGYGEDGALWGGEFLLADYCGFQRVAHLEPMALLGGAQAMRQPWRNLYAQLVTALGWERLEGEFGDLPLVQFLQTQPRSLLDQMLTTGLQTPKASSAGRLFDAVAAAVGCCRDAVSYEGQAAIALETLATKAEQWPAEQWPAEQWPGDRPGYKFARYQSRQHQPGQLADPLRSDCPTRQILSARSLWSPLLQDLQQGVEPAAIAAKFHRGFAEAIASLALELTATHGVSQVVLSGGVFQNQQLSAWVLRQLQRANLTVLMPQQVPANDGGLSLGQGAIAAARLLQRAEHQPQPT